MIRLSLLVVHYFEVLYAKPSHASIIICGSANFTFLVVTITLSILTEHPSTSSKVKNNVEYLYVAFATFLNLLIASLLGYFGGVLHYRVVRSRAPGHRKDLMPLKSPTAVLLMNWTLVTMYALRGVLTLVVGLGLTHLPSDGQMTYAGGRGRTPLFPFTYYVLVEILPCVIVAITLWQPVTPLGKRESSSESNAVVDAKFDHLFEGRGSTVSRDGDQSVKVLWSHEVLSELQRQRQQDEWDRNQTRASDVSALSSASASWSQQQPLHLSTGTSPYSEQYGNFVYFGSPGFTSSSPLTNPLLVHSHAHTSYPSESSAASTPTDPHGSYTPATLPPSRPSSNSFSPRHPAGVAMLSSGMQESISSMNDTPSSSWLDGYSTGHTPSAPLPRPCGLPLAGPPQHIRRQSAGEVGTPMMAPPVLMRNATGGLGAPSEAERAEQARHYAAELSPAYILRGCVSLL